MEKIDKEWYLLILIPIFFLFLGTNTEVKVKNTKDCFPDYRPYFKCFLYEKLP